MVPFVQRNRGSMAVLAAQMRDVTILSAPQDLSELTAGSSLLEEGRRYSFPLLVQAFI